MAIDTQNSVLAQQERNAQTRIEIDAAVKQYTNGIKLDGMDLSKNYGQLLAVIADKDGNVLTETTPFGGTQPAIIIQAQTWQCADAINQKMGVLGGTKFMAWRWSVEDGRYVPDRTKYQHDGSVRVGDKGVIDDVIARHLLVVKRAPSSSLPGVAELDFLRQEAVAQLKLARAHKSETDKAPKGMPKDATRKITKYWANYMRSMHAEPADVIRMLQAEYVELFPKK